MGDPTRLYGLNALVLNAGDGIGEAIARTYAKAGAKVLIAGRSMENLQPVADSVRADGGSGCSCTC